MESNHYGFVLVINGNYWSHLCQNQSEHRKPKYFVRTGAVGPIATEKLLFYVTKRMQVLGMADFVERIVGSPDDLWAMFGAETFFESIEEFKTYTAGSRKVTFVRFENFQEFSEPKPKDDVVRVLDSLVWIKPRYVSEENAQLLVGKAQ